MENPILKRIRDGKRYFKPQQKITATDWADITDKAAEAEQFFKKNSRIVGILNQSLLDAEQMIMENRVREVREEHTISETLTKVFTTPKKIQDDELVGQIKFIRTFMAELKSWVDFKAEVEHLEAEGTVVVERGERK